MSSGSDIKPGELCLVVSVSPFLLPCRLQAVGMTVVVTELVGDTSDLMIGPAYPSAHTKPYFTCPNCGSEFRGWPLRDLKPLRGKPADQDQAPTGNPREVPA